jgi:hypothetical protein
MSRAIEEAPINRPLASLMEKSRGDIQYGSCLGEPPGLKAFQGLPAADEHQYSHFRVLVRRQQEGQALPDGTLRHLCRGGVRASRGISLDLDQGGLGAIVQGTVHVGDRVAIDLRRSEQLLTTVAVLRHTSSVRSGFEVVGLTPEERPLITSAIG